MAVIPVIFVLSLEGYLLHLGEIGGSCRTLLAASAIRKHFLRTVALDGVDFCARPGEIHAIVGENGAGKSTLINIFAGRLHPSSGLITLDGVALKLGSPDTALRSGIAAVYQSPMLFERMSWEENLALGGFGDGSMRLDLDAVVAQANQLADCLGFKLPSRGALVEERSMAERVRLEILRALSFNPRVLILDEPTGVLAPGELAAFLDMLRRLRAEGRIVVLVTHKLAEALAVADRITVLRHGRVIAERLAHETDETDLARLMIGDIGSPPPRKPIYYRAVETPVLVLENLTLERDGHRVLDGVSLTLHAGEIAGIGGVDGNGQAELVEMVAGVRAPTAGRLRVPVPDGAANALAVIPQNRDLDGLILEMNIWENLILARALRKRFTGRLGWLHCGRASKLCGEVLGRFQIRASGPTITAAALSGGNRQRLAVARALSIPPSVIVAHDICRGLDIAATVEVHRRLREYAGAGGAVLLISSGRLSVISRGRLMEVPLADRNPARIGLLMSGTVQ